MPLDDMIIMWRGDRRMPNYIVSQLYCRVCGHKLDGFVDLGWWTLQCDHCGWFLDDQEAKHEYEVAIMGLGADIPVGGLHA